MKKIVWIDHKEVPWGHLRRAVLKPILRTIIKVILIIGTIKLLGIALF